MLDVRLAKQHVWYSSKNWRICTLPTLRLTRSASNSMDNWLAWRSVLPLAWNGPEEPIQWQIGTSAFKAQATIGWDQFLFRGRIAKAWSKPIGTYYKIRQPGESFTPDQWMRTVIKELWVFSITTIWKQRNSELHGMDGAISMAGTNKERNGNRGLWQWFTSWPLVRYPKRTALCFIMLESRKFSSGRKNIWTHI
jgi:hypothetical protein